jgi:hypothetical protein
MMNEAAARHVAHLRRVFALAFAGIVLVAAVVVASDPPETLRVEQGRSLLWAFVALAVLNLITVMPVHRAMLAGPRRVFAVNGNAEDLLRSHRLAHAVAMARVAGVSLLGLIVYLMTGEREWFWMFGAVAAVGMCGLWPLKRQIEALLAGGAPPVS